MSPRRRETNLSALFTWRSAISSPESGLTPTEHHVALTLSLHMNELGGSCYPSIFPTQHEETCGRSAATIREALNQIAWLGWIERTVRVGREQSNEYAARIPEWYENHRREADKSVDVAVRRAAAIAAATSAHGPREKAPRSGAAAKENHLREAGSSDEASETKTAGANRENRRTRSAKPPGSGSESDRRASRERQTAAGSGPSSRSSDAGNSEEREDPAAAEPARDAEVIAVVEALPGADLDSPKRIVPLAHGLPRRTFFATVATLEQRIAAGGVRNACGLLVTLLNVARAEQTAIASAQLLAELGPGRAYVPAPWVIDSLKRDDPERYVRLLAGSLPNESDLRDALRGHERLGELVELYRAVRRNVVDADKLGTPEQERRRWVERHHVDPDVHHVVDAWDDVDDVERQELHELADTLRAADADAQADVA